MKLRHLEGLESSDTSVNFEGAPPNFPANLVRRVMHPDGRFTYAFMSAQLLELVDVKPEELDPPDGATFHWIHPDDREKFIRDLKDSARTLTPANMEFRVRARDGDLRWIKSSGNPQRLPDGTVIWDEIAIDFTETRAADRQMRAALEGAENANRAMANFLAAASHDLRQPLQAIRFHLAGYRNRLAQGTDDPVFSDVDRCVDVMEALLRSLLDISNLDSGMVAVRPKRVDLEAFMPSLLADLTPEAEAAGVSLWMDGAEGAVQTDPTLLDTVCRNLVHNAIKYTPSGGSVRVRARGGAVPRITIADTGVGIARKDRLRIFQPFIQVLPNQNASAKGLGLGLAIVERIISLLGGAISCRSSVGRGTVFSISLPHIEPTEAATANATAGATEAKAVTLEDQRIWVIENEPEVQSALSALITSWGAQVMIAGSRQELDALIRNNPFEGPDILLADYRLSEYETGLAAVEETRHAFGKHVPAIILTGETAAESLRILRATDNLVLSKPVKAGRLKAALRSCIKLMADAPAIDR